MVRDTAPPSLVIEYPAGGQILGAAAVTLVGLVNDIVPGTVNASNCRVVVSSRAGSRTAELRHRTFVVEEFSLVPGPNLLTAVATDAAGNVGEPFELTVIRQDPAGQRIVTVSGGGQSGGIGAPLDVPFVVALVSESGNPVPGRLVTFTVTRGDGTLAHGGIFGRRVSVVSDAAGRASVEFTLGSRAGAGNHRVTALATGFAGEVVFAASALAGSAAGVKTFMGETQTGAVGRPLPAPFIVFVHDMTGNPVRAAPITFQVTRGGGSIAGQPAAIIPSDDDGLARVLLTLGPEPGIHNNIVEANVPGVGGAPAILTASALAPGPAEQTRVSGVVLDNSNLPVPGATIRIPGTALETATDAQGRFTIPGAPVGTIHLRVDATTTPRMGTWPVLEFVLTTISGQDNTLNMPIFVLTLDTPSARVAGGSENITLQMANVPGVALTVFANSLTCPDGSTQCPVLISQVHNDKVPMPPLGGAAPRLIWTVQPAGARFDPPARVTYPNLDALAPGAVVEVMSFDHDLGQYVSTGTATVSEDGSVITSDPGGGIAHAGWGYPICTPPGDPCVCQCDDKNPCTADSCADCPECEYVKLTNEMCCDGKKFDPEKKCCIDKKLRRKWPIRDLEDCPNRVPYPDWEFQYNGCTFISDNPAHGEDTAFANAQHTGPCDSHDRCYQTCNSEDGARLSCDLQFRTNALAICEAAGDPQNVKDSCATSARRYYRWIRFLGSTPFRNRQEKVCQCCP